MRRPYVLGSVLFQGSSQTRLTLGFAFALIAVLYLVIEELMMEAHKSFEDLWEPSILFTEFGVYYIITHLLG